MEISDDQIVRQVAQGETEAYAELVQRYQKPIYNLMYRFCPSEVDAAELTQGVFCKVFENLASFQNGRQFFPWLYTLAMNHGRDWSRKQAKKRAGLRQYAESMDQSDWAPPLEAIEKRQEVSQMLEAVSNLPFEKREILLLRYQQELSIGELGEIFNLSDSAVKMRIHRSLALLQDQLKGVSDSND